MNRIPRDSKMWVTTYSPGWFHEGANKPDFNRVDIRTTQQKIYDSHEYVTSNLNPGVVFRGRELEFNPNTKYFYTDRALPKKKLTEPEMVEINRLYRIIGRCEQQLAALQSAQSTPTLPTAQATPSTSAQASQSLLGSWLQFVAHNRLLVILALLAVVYVCRK
ncbi:MAG: hypothetical protein PHQ12_11180 [Chthoniobacteraceae bacterium]|nr:hypothetical protein [Chthoniobacteraceae bacterium]